MIGWLRVLNAACLAVALCIGGYYVFFEPPFLTYPNLPFPVLTPKVKHGDAVQLDVRRCNSDTKTRVYGLAHSLVGETVTILLPAMPTSLPPGCAQAVSVINVVPQGTPPGTYHIEGYAEVQGTLRTYSIPWRSAPFEVVE